VVAWWGDQNLEPKVLVDDPETVPINDKQLAASSSIANKLPSPDHIWPCFSSAFLNALNQSEHVHNGNRGVAGLLMGVAVRNRIYAFIYEARTGGGSWQMMTDKSGVNSWPQIFGDTTSLVEMLNSQNPRERENIASLAKTKTPDEFAGTAKRWIEQTEKFQKEHRRSVTVGMPAYTLTLNCNGHVAGVSAL
jgi:hypothetical protein